MVNQSPFIELLKTLKNNVILIIISTMLGVITSSVFTYSITPQYSSTTQLLVNQNRGEQSGIEMDDINTNVHLIDTYAELIKGPAVLDEVRDNLTIDLTTDQLTSKIVINSPENSQLFNLTVTDSNPDLAAEIANSVATTFQSEISNIMNSVGNVVITYAAEPRLNPISPNNTRNIAIGTILGLMVGVGIALLKDALDITFRDTEFITEEIGWNNLGSIHKFNT